MKKIATDEVLAALRRDDTAHSFVAARLIEVLDGSVFLERENFLRQVMDKLAAKSAECEKLQTQWSDFNAKLQARDQLLAQKEQYLTQELQKAREDLAARTSRVGSLEQTVQQQQTTIEELKSVRAEMDKDVAALRARMHGIERHSVTLSKTESRWQEEIERLRGQLDLQAKLASDKEALLQAERQELLAKLRDSEAHARREVERARQDAGLDGAQRESVAQDLRRQLERLSQQLATADAHAAAQVEAVRRSDEERIATILRSSKERLDLAVDKLEDSQKQVAQLQMQLGEQRLRGEELARALEEERERHARLAATFESSEKERLELRHKYVLVGEKMETLLRADESTSGQALAYHQQQARMLVQKLQEERRVAKQARKAAKDKYVLLTRTHARTLTTHARTPHTPRPPLPAQGPLLCVRARSGSLTCNVGSAS